MSPARDNLCRREAQAEFSPSPPGTVLAVPDVLVLSADKVSRFHSVGDLLIEMDGAELKFDHSEIGPGVASPTCIINPMTERAGQVAHSIPAAAANEPLFWTPGCGFDTVRFAPSAPASPVTAATPTAQPSSPADVPVTTSATGGRGAVNLAGSDADSSGGAERNVRLWHKCQRGRGYRKQSGL